MRVGKERNRKRGERGQSLVETALVIPFLLLLLMIVVDAARAFDALIVLTNAAREGARYASLEPTPRDADIYEFIIEDVVGSGTNVTQMTEFITDNISYGEGGTEENPVLTVTLSYEFPLWFGGLVGLDTVNLEKSATMATASLFKPSEAVAESWALAAFCWVTRSMVTTAWRIWSMPCACSVAAVATSLIKVATLEAFSSIS